MFSNNPRSDTFILTFPDTFFVEEICKNYNDFLKQKPYVLESIQEILLESIKEFDTPEFGYTPVEQNSIDSSNAGFGNPNISKESVQKLTERTFSVTFRHTDGFMTYFLMLEHFFHRYKFGNREARKPFGTIILETQFKGKMPFGRIKYKNCQMTGITNLSLNYSTPSRDMSTFTCTFSYSEFSTTFEIPDLKIKA